MKSGRVSIDQPPEGAPTLDIASISLIKNKENLISMRLDAPLPPIRKLIVLKLANETVFTVNCTEIGQKPLKFPNYTWGKIQTSFSTLKI